MKERIKEIFDKWIADEGEGFSGVFSVSDDNGVVFEAACGFRNMSEQLPNEVDTAFAIASGTKMFTGLAICKLIDDGKLSIDDKISDLLKCDLGQIDKDVTVFQLLTHTSGVGDYVDEDAEDFDEQMQVLRNKYPAHLWTNLEYYLQMITPLAPKFVAGERYGYSNSGYILLGLIIEAASGQNYHDFVRENIIESCKMVHTGFYRNDSLPTNTAMGYVEDEDDETLRTNVFSVPIMGGSDGGLFTCSADLDNLWRAVFSGKILSKKMTEAFLTNQVWMDEEDGESYGLGVYRFEQDGNMLYYAVGVDAGVDFFTAYLPKQKIVASAFANTDNINTFPLLEGILEM